MILITKLWSLFAIISLVSASFLVQLCSSVSVDSFIQKYPMISKDISKVYQFGAFQGIAGNFDLKTVKFLQQLKSEVRSMKG